MPGLATRCTPDELLERAGIYIPPVDVYAIARQLHIDVFLTAFTQEDGEDVAGSIEIEDGIPVIYVKNGDSPKRQRFTIAHELGHLCNGHLSDSDKIIDNAECRRSSEWNPREQQANQFAAELLMPAKFLEQAIKSGIKDCYSLALLFNVSQPAMAYRLQNVRGVVC